MDRFCVLLFAFMTGVSSSKFPRGVIHPEICGGDAFPLEVRVSDCDEVPCQLLPSVPHLIEIDFFASADSNQLTFKLTVDFFEHEFVVWDRPIENSAVSEGKSYTVSYSLTPEPISSGYHVNLIVEIIDTATGRVELCVTAPADLL